MKLGWRQSHDWTKQGNSDAQFKEPRTSGQISWRKGRSRFLLRFFALFLPILLVSGVLGMGLEQTWAQPPQELLVAANAGDWDTSGDDRLDRPANGSPDMTLASLDAVPEGLQLGQSVYIRECATCHIAPSPAVLPTQTWASLLVTPQHYGVQIEVMRSPTIDLVWDYVQFASRSIMENETAPDRIRDSRFFRALHPRVEVERIDLASCAGCHPNAWDYDYRTLSPEWQDAP